MSEYESKMGELSSPRLSEARIVAMWKERQEALGPVHAQMRRFREAVNGDVIVPLNELDRHAKVDVANLMVQGLDQMSMRIASVMPSVSFTPERESESAKKRARTKKAAVLTMWDDNFMDRKLSRRARHLIGYSQSAVMIRPDMHHLRPKWTVINPLDLYLPPTEDPDDPTPHNSIVARTFTYAKLMHRYPQVAFLRRRTVSPESKVMVLEYQDEYEVTQIAVGDDGEDVRFGTMPAVRLEWVPNRANCPLVVSVERMAIDRARGMFDDMIGMFYSRARLAALNHIAIEQGIYPNEWVVSRPGETATVVQQADGRRGVIGIIEGGDLRTENLNPGYKTDTAIDRIERQERTAGGVPPEFGGESTTNIRTGRRGDSVMSATVDFRVQDAQNTLALSLRAENEIAIKTELAYWGSAPKSFYFPGKTKRGDYTPKELWDTPRHNVWYTMPGADINALSVGLGQKVGIGIMSKETARESDPLIADPDLEHDRIIAEGLEAALLSSVQSQAADPQGPYQPDDLAFLTEQVLMKGKTLFEAIQLTQERAQERQATPVEPGVPEAMPGLSPPGMGMEQPTVAPPPEGVANLASLMRGLRAGAAV